MKIWIVDQNPLQLPEPPQWWQDLVSGYDKMLRIMPSQKEHVYRLCRLVRREARLGLQTMVVHDHPDTRAMIKFGCVPVAPVWPWAINSPNIIRDLRARDTWAIHGGDPNKIVDEIEANEKAAEAKQAEESSADFDERAANAFRAVKYGRPTQVDYGQRPPNAFRELFRDDVKPLAPLPALKPLADGLQNRVPSDASPPAGSPGADHKNVILTDL